MENTDANIGGSTPTGLKPSPEREILDPPLTNVNTSNSTNPLVSILAIVKLQVSCQNCHHDACLQF